MLHRFFLLSLLFLTLNTLAEAPAMVGGDISYKNKYVWRGITFNEEAVLWSDLWINWNEFTCMVFASNDLTDINGGQGRLTEFDLYLEYSHSFKPLTMTLGYAHYSYPWHVETVDAVGEGTYDIGKGTGEFYTTLATNFDVVNLSTSLWVDVLNVRGVYFNPAITVSHTFKELLTPELKLGIGMGDTDHNAQWIGVAETGINDFTSALTLSYVLPGKAGENFSIAADLNYSIVVDETIKDALTSGGAETDNFWFGLTLNGYITPKAEEK